MFPDTIWEFSMLYKQIDGFVTASELTWLAYVRRNVKQVRKAELYLRKVICLITNALQKVVSSI